MHFNLLLPSNKMPTRNSDSKCKGFVFMKIPLSQRTVKPIPKLPLLSCLTLQDSPHFNIWSKVTPNNWFRSELQHSSSSVLVRFRLTLHSPHPFVLSYLE